jgi:hypothetical protein
MERQRINAQHINADNLESAFIIGLLGGIVGIADENRFWLNTPIRRAR